MKRRDFLAVAATGAGLLRAAAAPKIDRTRISAISDEVARTEPDAIAFAHRFGLQWVELRYVPGGKTSYFGLDEKVLQATAKQFKDGGIGVSFLNTSLLKFGLPGTEPVMRNETPEARTRRLAREQAMFDRRMDELHAAIRAAHIFECDKLRVFAFRRVQEPEKLYPRIAEVLRPMIVAAEREGVKVLLENEASCNVGLSSEIAPMLKITNEKNFGCNWDSLNGLYLGERPFPDGYQSVPKDKMWNLQIKGHSVLDPATRLDWAEIFRTLEHDGYQGKLGLETHYSNDPSNVIRSTESMTEIMRIIDATPS